MVFENQGLGFRDFFFSSAAFTPRVPALPKMGSVGDWEVTAESQVSCYLFFPSCSYSYSTVALQVLSDSRASPQKCKGIKCYLCPIPSLLGPSLVMLLLVMLNPVMQESLHFSPFSGTCRIPRLFSKISNI